MTTVSQLMTRGVRSMRPSDNVMAAAQVMEELNVGAIPVCDGDKLIGMVTDRDIIVRGVAQNRDAKTTRLSDVMSTQVRTVHENDNVDKILREMGSSQIRRLPVVDDQAHLIGIVSLGQVHRRQRRCGHVAGRYFITRRAEPLRPVAGQRRGGQRRQAAQAGGLI